MRVLRLIMNTNTMGFGHDFDHPELFIASDTEGVRRRAAPR